MLVWRSGEPAAAWAWANHGSTAEYRRRPRPCWRILRSIQRRSVASAGTHAYLALSEDFLLTLDWARGSFAWYRLALPTLPNLYALSVFRFRCSTLRQSQVVTAVHCIHHTCLPLSPALLYTLRVCRFYISGFASTGFTRCSLNSSNICYNIMYPLDSRGYEVSTRGCVPP